MSTAVLALLLILGACEREQTPPPVRAAVVKRAPVETDRARYVFHEGPFGPETTIVSTYTAPANHDVYLLNCNGAFAVGLQRPNGDRWEHVWAPAMSACMSAPIVIRAGESRQATIVVTPRRMDAKIDTGTYRVVWHGLLGSYDPNASPPGLDLPIEQRVSAPIHIDVTLQ
ncbi:MAG: hypothetical protein ACJ74H_12810 [Thermoanaerobaculia bacterium]